MQSVSWLPIDVAARSIIEIATDQTDILPSVLHCAHPHPTAWNSIISLFAETLYLRNKHNRPLSIVSFSEWIEHVNKSVASCEVSPHEIASRFPSTKIQSTLHWMVFADEELRRMNLRDLDDGIQGVEAAGTRRLRTTKAESLSSSLKGVLPLGEGDVIKWVDYWVKKGLFV